MVEYLPMSRTGYDKLSAELNFNLLFSKCGHLTLAHTDRAMFVMANRAEVNRLQGIDSRLIGPEEVQKLAPAMHVGEDATEAIAEGARAVLRPSGALVLEVADGTAARVSSLLRELSYSGVETTLDLAGRDRVVEGRR